MSESPPPIWTDRDRALLGFYERAEKRLTQILVQSATTGWRTAYTEDRLIEARKMIDDLLARQKRWSEIELPRAYRSGQKATAAANQRAGPPFSAIDRRVVNTYVLSTVETTEEALRSIVPSLERVFVGARQEIITSQQLQTQIAEGLVEGLSPGEMTRRIRRALQTGATQRLKGYVPDELRERLKETAEGKFISLRCRDGLTRRYQLPYYSRLVVQSSRAMASAEGALQAAVEFGLDLVQISVHVGACLQCIPHQGMVYSLTGETPGFPLLTAENRPPYHPQCAHRLLPTSAETLEAEGSLDDLRRFSGDEGRVVETPGEYLEVLAGASRGVAISQSALGAA